MFGNLSVLYTTKRASEAGARSPRAGAAVELRTDSVGPRAESAGFRAIYHIVSSDFGFRARHGIYTGFGSSEP